MATVGEHNKLIGYHFNGNKHLKHVLSNEEIKDMTMIEERFPLSKLPVCAHCERLGLWTRDFLTKKPCGYCKACGSITRQPVTYATYLAQKMDVDATGHTFKQMSEVDKKCENYKRLVYLPDFTSLEDMCR